MERIDQNALDLLFHDDPRPDDRIQVALLSIARIAAAGARCPRSDREDVAGEVHVHLVQKVLPSYRAERNSAFAYFMKAAIRESWRAVGRMGKDRRRAVALPKEIDGRLERPTMRAAASPTWKNRDAIHRIDRSLLKLGRAARELSDPVSLRDARLIAAALQEIRRGIAQGYRRLELPGVKYTRDRKIEFSD